MTSAKIKGIREATLLLFSSHASEMWTKIFFLLLISAAPLLTAPPEVSFVPH